MTCYNSTQQPNTAISQVQLVGCIMKGCMILEKRRIGGSFRFKDLFVWHRVSSRGLQSQCWSLLAYHRPAKMPHSAFLIFSTKQHEFCPNIIQSYLCAGFIQCRANRSFNRKGPTWLFHDLYTELFKFSAMFFKHFYSGS